MKWQPFAGDFALPLHSVIQLTPYRKTDLMIMDMLNNVKN